MRKSMQRQVLVLGLGQFGMGLTRSLVERGAEVIAVDQDESKIHAAAEFATEALCFDVTDEDSLAKLSPAERDVCICATGDQSREAGILCTALLKQMGAKKIIARANDELHMRILYMVGADDVVNPEWAFGERYSSQIVYDRILGQMPLGHDLVITECKAPEIFVGRNLIELDLRRQYQVIVVAVRSGESGSVSLPDPKQMFGADDILIVVSREKDVLKMLDRI